MSTTIEIPQFTAETLSNVDRATIRGYWTRHLNALRPFYGSDICTYTDWDNAKKAARATVWNVSSIAADPDRKEAIGSVFLETLRADRAANYIDRVTSSAFTAASAIGLDVASAASWETLKDLPDYKINPFIPLYKIYRKGALIGNVKDVKDKTIDKAVVLTKSGWDIPLL